MPMTLERKLDGSTLLDMVGGDPQLLRQIGAMFLADYPAALERLRAALAAGDRDRLNSVVHSLKGSAASFGAGDAVRLAQDIEKACRAGDLAGVPALADQFERHIGELAALLAESVSRPAA